MKQAIVNFCKSTDTGLFLLDMPTGFGKTYSVLEFMVDYYDSPEFKDKKIFFVTTLKKNLPDKELREHFAKRGKADDYDKYCLRIEANADMVVEKLDELYRARKIPAAITMKQEFKDLHGSVKLLNEYRDKKRELKGTSKDIINVLCKNAEDAIRKQQEGAFRKVMILVPSDVGIFKKLLLSKKQAKIKLTFRDGHIEIKEWNARSFTEKSDVLNNIRSKTWWREKDSLGIIKVEVTIV